MPRKQRQTSDSPPEPIQGPNDGRLGLLALFYPDEADQPNWRVDWMAMNVEPSTPMPQIYTHGRQALVDYVAGERQRRLGENDASIDEHRAWVEQRGVWIWALVRPGLSQRAARAEYQRLQDAMAAFGLALNRS